MTTVRIELPPKLIPLFEGEADVRAADGGRGSAKTRSFAKMTAVRAYMWDMAGRSGQILCGRQFMNSLEDSSLEEVKAAIRSEPWLSAHFDIGEKYIRTKSSRIYYTFVGLDRNVASIKSRAKILLAWVDEAEPVSDNAWSILIPTLREEDSELWVTWNSKRKNAPVEKRFKNSDDPRIKHATINWRDNPWFPDILERVRQRDMRERPDSYAHIWEGAFVTTVEGAYFSKQLIDARAQGRIGKVPPDSLMSIKLFADIGGTGAKADNFVFWAAQFVGKEIRVLDHYETQGQPLGAHLEWMRSRKYLPGKVTVVLPHDGDTQDRVFDVSYASAFRRAGYDVQVMPNQGKGAANARIESVRRLFPSIWINEETCKNGISALEWYHERKDDKRDIGLGPEHDWSSHSADAFGLMCVAYEEPRAKSSVPVFVRRKVV